MVTMRSILLDPAVHCLFSVLLGSIVVYLPLEIAQTDLYAEYTVVLWMKRRWDASPDVA
jgi:hypothetical protein